MSNWVLEALREYGDHKYKCAVRREMRGNAPVTSDCDCGWRDASARCAEAQNGDAAEVEAATMSDQDFHRIERQVLEAAGIVSCSDNCHCRRADE